MVGNSVDRFNGLVSSLAIKSPCVVASDVNLVLDGVQTVNGVAVVSGDRVLVKDQTNPVENGIYDVTSSTWNRSADFDGNRDVTLNTIVLAGVNASEPVVYRVTSALPIIIGTTAINWAQGIRGAGTINVVEDLTPQLGGNLLSNTFDIDMLDNDYVNFGTNSDVVMGFNGVTFNVDYLPTGGTWNITGFDSIDVGASDIVLTSAGGSSYTVTADDAYGTFSVEAATPSLGQYGIKLDLGGNAYIGGATQWGGGSETIAGAKPVEGDLFYNQFLLETSDILSDLAVFGLNGTQAVEVGSYVQGGEVVLRTTGTGGFEDYEWSFVVDAGTQAVWIQDGYSFRIGNASGGVVTRPTIYVDFAHDGTDLNIAGVNTTDINITGLTGRFTVAGGLRNNLEHVILSNSPNLSANHNSLVRFSNSLNTLSLGLIGFDAYNGLEIKNQVPAGPLLLSRVSSIGNTAYILEASDTYVSFGHPNVSVPRFGWKEDFGEVFIISSWTPALPFDTTATPTGGLRLKNGGSVLNSTFGADFGMFGTNRLHIKNYMRSGVFDITGTDAAGGAATMATFSPVASADLSYANVVVVKTKTAATGGLEANNTQTGAGFERVLTQSDSSRTSTTAELVAIANAINTAAEKEAGFMVFNTTTNKPVWAVGNADASVWVDATGATAHTPI